MPEINKVGSNIQSGGSSASGAEQFMDLLKDQHIASFGSTWRKKKMGNR